MTLIAVIGGGIAGTSAAFELAADAEITVFEQESTCGYHSTGRSAADRVVRVTTRIGAPTIVPSRAATSVSAMEP